MKKRLLRELPSVDELLRSGPLKEAASLYSLPLVTGAVRKALEEARSGILSGSATGVSFDRLVEDSLMGIRRALSSNVRRVVNASGTVLHTNIGRAVLSEEAVEAVMRASGNINLEFDIERGERGERDSLVEDLVKRLTGAEAATIVNNNAAAVLLTLNSLAEGKEVVISRGELIEIGGSFRLPEIIKKSGCVLKEVGTTNRTHPQDYSEAITGNTALLFKAHTSNYTVVGFTSEVALQKLVAIGTERSVPVVEDLGSGSLVDLSKYGLPKEPLVSESIGAGADVVTFSGDKLLGGPQCGIVAGKKEFVDRIRKNPLKRALRPGKLTLASLEATLRLYLDPERLPQRLPTLRHLSRPLGDIEESAKKAASLISDFLGPSFTVSVEDDHSVVGGGSLPGHRLPTKVVAVTHESAGPERIMRLFLDSTHCILGRIKKERFLLDMRTVEEAADVVPSVRF